VTLRGARGAFPRNHHPIAEAEWAKAVKIIGTADQVCLACHVRPDADALGTMVALALALGQRTQVVASVGDTPFTVPAALDFLPGLGLLTPPEGYPAAPDVMVTLDVSSIDRLGPLGSSAGAAAELIVLDHHASNTRFGSVNLVDPAAAATAVLARELIGRLGLTVTQDVAVGLYTGLTADTGSFKFSTTTPAVHQLAAELLDTGVDPSPISRRLYDTAPFGYLRMLSAALNRAVLEPAACNGLGLVWTTVTRADREQAGLGPEAGESVIDIVRRTAEAEVALVLKESDDGSWQASVRSKDRIDVGKACTALGGGGHARAAGFTASGGPDEAASALKAVLDQQ
jgi:bifunctional oligoribonuclease and PAP phosphatase NrnA